MEVLSDRAAVLQACAVLDQKMAALREQLAAMETTRHGLAHFLETTELGQDDEEARKHVLLTLVRRAGNLGAALQKLAEEGRGRLHLGKAVDLIWDSGITDAKKRGSVRSMATRWVRTHEGWVAEGGDIFAYVPALPPGDLPRPMVTGEQIAGAVDEAADEGAVVAEETEHPEENETSGALGFGLGL